MSSLTEGHFSQKQIATFLHNDEHLCSSFHKLISKSRPQSYPASSFESTPEEIAIRNISNFSVSLFNIIQTEAAMGNLSLKMSDVDQPRAFQYYELPFLKDSFFKNLLFAKIIQQLFAECLNIKIDYNKQEWTLTWDKENPLLCFKPLYEPPCQLPSIQKTYLTHLYANGPDFDVLFLVEDQPINAHRIFLKQSPFFVSLLQDRWKGKEESIVIESFSYRVFKAVIRFLYVGELEEQDIQHSKTLFELYSSSDLLEYPPLKDYCKTLFSQLIDEKTFLTFAFYQEIFEDEYLFQLCQWFIVKNFDYGKKLEISHFTPKQLLETYRVCRKYNAKEFEKVCLLLLENHLEIDIDLIEFHQVLDHLDDRDLKLWFQQHIQRIEKKVI